MDLIYKWLYAHPYAELDFYIERNLSGHNLTIRMRLKGLEEFISSMIDMDYLYSINLQSSSAVDYAIKSVLDGMYNKLIDQQFQQIDERLTLLGNPSYYAKEE